jgi:outer membrane receptor protein involved in Fe transport
LALILGAEQAKAELSLARPLAPIEPSLPSEVTPRNVRILLHIVVEVDGTVGSAEVVERVPADAPEVFAEAAADAVRKARFQPSVRDGVTVRSRVECLVVFKASAAAAALAESKPPAVAPSDAPLAVGDGDGRGVGAANSGAKAAPFSGVVVRGSAPRSARGLGDTRLERDQLEAAPHQQTSELLAAAPGLFVDHEDGEGLGNDVYLRGFDLDHGSGIEMHVGPVPINIPIHIRGQGYADADFIIPEMVQSVRVLEGIYDPRQGDAAIVGSANFELAAPEAGYLLKASYGSFNQRRLLVSVAPDPERLDTFLAFAGRKSDGFGARRASESASLNAGYGAELGAHDKLRVLATAYAANSELPGVIREDDLNAGRIGWDDSYPYFARNQSVSSARVVLGAELSHLGRGGARFAISPWLMWTQFRARQNYTGALESSQQNPELSGLGDLFQTTNQELAVGMNAAWRSKARRIARNVSVVIEPGSYLRFGQTQQGKSLLEPDTLAVWDRRVDARLGTLDAGAYLDLDLRVGRWLRVAGGARADFLCVSTVDRLASVPASAAAPDAGAPGARLRASGLAAGPRLTLDFMPIERLSLVASYGEGFRSLDVSRLREGARPFSKVRSAEAGLRAADARQRYTVTLAFFETWLENELVFAAESGGLETENASVRRGVVSSLVARPTSWFLASSALSISDAEYRTRAPGISHHVPNVPPILFRLDLSVHGALGRVRGKALFGRIFAGYTFLSPRHLSDSVLGPQVHVLNVGASCRYGFFELGLDVYNALFARYADNADVFVSNWSFRPGQQPASTATHLVAAPPTAVLASVSAHF